MKSIQENNYQMLIQIKMGKKYIKKSKYYENKNFMSNFLKLGFIKVFLVGFIKKIPTGFYWVGGYPFQPRYKNTYTQTHIGLHTHMQSFVS